MMRNAARMGGLGLVMLAAACSDASQPFDPNGVPQMLATPAPVDIGGAWAWSETTIWQFPSFVGEQFFNLESEGPLFRSTCESSGTLTIEQSGETFTGGMTQTGICTTRGGQTFSIPWPSFPINGHVKGQSLHADVDTTCRLNARIEMDQGTAVAMAGAGGCPIPPTGVNKSLHWQATRL